MERRLTEEQVTKSIIRWLISKGWSIIAFDFPQSGTGRCIHPIDSDSKTYGIWIPDIVAHKDSNLIFFENKDRYVYKDFEKVEKLKSTNTYLNSIHEITNGYDYSNIYYGIGFPEKANYIEKSKEFFDKIDFLICAIDKDNARVQYDPFSLFN